MMGGVREKDGYSVKHCIKMERGWSHFVKGHTRLVIAVRIHALLQLKGWSELNV